MSLPVKDKATPITNPAGLIFYGYKEGPDGDFKISYSDLVAAVLTQINNLTTLVNRQEKRALLTNQSANTQWSIPADGKITCIDFIVISGSPIISVFSGAEEIISEQPADLFTISRYAPTTEVLDINISGGTVTIVINYYENRTT